MVISRDEAGETLGFADKGNCAFNVDVTSGDPSQCYPSEMKCGDGTCIPKTSMNDQVFDCLDGTDEPGGVNRVERCKMSPVTGTGAVPKGPGLWRTGNGKVQMQDAVSPQGMKIALLYCDTGYTPVGDSQVYCNSNAKASGNVATGGWESQFPATPCKLLTASSTSCIEAKGPGGITCGQLLVATGKCATGQGCDQTDCDWAKSTYSLDCTCNCAAANNECQTLQTIMDGVCKAETVMTSPFTCDTIAAPTCVACNASQTSNPAGECVAAGVGQQACTPCSPCAHPCTLAIVDHYDTMMKCNTNLTGSWGPYTASIQSTCGAPEGASAH